MKLSRKAGSTSQSIDIFIQNAASANGAGLTGLVYNSSGLTAYYMLPRAAAVAITLATLAAVTSAWSSGGFKEIDATNAPGWYRFDIPDAALASGSFVDFHFRGAAGMVETPVELELTAHDNQSLEHYLIDEVATAQGYSANTVTLANGTKAYPGDFIYTYSATTGAKQLHEIFSIDATTPTAKIATVDPSFPSTITGTLVYWLVKGPPAPTVNKPNVNVDTAVILAAIKADAEWKTLQAQVNGQWGPLLVRASYPGYVTQELKGKTDGITYATHSLYCLTRPQILSRLST